MAADLQAHLDAVDAAILAFLTDGAIQTYTLLGRTVTRANLKELREWRAQLKIELSTLEDGMAVNHYRRGPI